MNGCIVFPEGYGQSDIWQPATLGQQEIYRGVLCWTCIMGPLNKTILNLYTFC